VGGGPAGLEAARIAAQRGHEVVLYEKQRYLGGSLPVAALVKGPREDIWGLVGYLSRQVKQAGVTVHLGSEVTREIVRREHPDAVVVAAGGTHEIPDIPGITGRNVLTGEALHSLSKKVLRFASPETVRTVQALPMARDVLIGKRVVVMGGRLHGCQTAEYLVGLGKQVTIVDTGSEAEIGEGLLEVFLKPYLLYWLKDNGVEFVTDVDYRRVTDEGLVVAAKSDGAERLLAADTVMTALPLLPNHKLVRELSGLAPEIHTIGDAGDPQLIIDAIAAGAAVGHQL
ncbi:MAG: FAD-dependent oxidoreductase, partial [Propionibacteriaceae bacterium]|nr:FAD-dependent oxidoreductase [Propionibacteriaceae bacterium]